MGFGHRVYKNFDPRAKLLKAACDRIFNELGIHDPLLDLAKQHRGGRAQRRLLRLAQALPERRLLQRHHLPRDGHPDRDVHGHVHARPPAGLDRALARAAQRPRRAIASTGRARSTPASGYAPSRIAAPSGSDLVKNRLTELNGGRGSNRQSRQRDFRLSPLRRSASAGRCSRERLVRSIRGAQRRPADDKRRSRLTQKSGFSLALLALWRFFPAKGVDPFRRRFIPSGRG